MKDYLALVLDLDGVVYRGDQLLPGARALVEWVDETHRRALYLSNNSLAPPDEVERKLARLGMPRPEGRVLTAGQAAARLVARRFPGGRVLVVGVPAVAGMVEATGLRLAWQDAMDGPRPDCVLVALDRTLTYDKLRRALRAIMAGAAFTAVNRDPRLPVEDGFDPGTGAIAVALQYASGVEAEIVGKPAPGIVHEALHLLGVSAEQALMVGDGLDLDVAAGRAAGVDTALVLTGLTTREQLQVTPADRQPTHVFDDLPALLAALRAA
jgi:HAD superfamily hydrolase (TIGR01450 family)